MDPNLSAIGRAFQLARAGKATDLKGRATRQYDFAGETASIDHGCCKGTTGRQIATSAGIILGSRNFQLVATFGNCAPPRSAPKLMGGPPLTYRDVVELLEDTDNENAPSEEARPLSKLAVALQTFPMESGAWNDFLDACKDILRFDKAGQPLDVGVTRNLWDCWSRVAAGQSGDYDAAGARVIDD